MAVLERTPTLTNDREARLAKELMQEWMSPQEAANAEPIIIVERTAEGLPAKHLYVIWSAWADMSPLQRSRIVLRTYEGVLRNQGEPQEMVTEVTVSMGLTPEEAKRMRLEY